MNKLVKAKVLGFKGRSGKNVPNQYRIVSLDAISGNRYDTFQSYDTVVAQKEQYTDSDGKWHLQVYLDEGNWNYSRTTSKYRIAFLGESTGDTLHKIATGEYQLANLN